MQSEELELRYATAKLYAVASLITPPPTITVESPVHDAWLFIMDEVF